MDTTYVIQIAIAVLTGSLLPILFNRRKTGAETRQLQVAVEAQISTMALALLNELKIDSERLRKEGERLMVENLQLRTENAKLVKLINNPNG